MYRPLCWRLMGTSPHCHCLLSSAGVSMFDADWLLERADVVFFDVGEKILVQVRPIKHLLPTS